MHIHHTIDQTRQAIAMARSEGKRIGFVPTLGALHRGHAALIERSVEECDFTVVSIFVNQLQFGVGEDFSKYPRTLDDDADLCRRLEVELIFAPPHEEMYPQTPRSFVEVDGLTDRLCGAFRPGHFRGVTTVVAKLFHIVLPDVAYFGEKDAQQLFVIRRMVRDLDFPIEIRGVETVREPDGLALSSRNRYLSRGERRAAPALYRGLIKAKAALDAGERDPERVRACVRGEIDGEPLMREQYVEVVDVESLQPVSWIDGDILIAAAVFVGDTRLIDNVRWGHRGGATARGGTEESTTGET